ncbi:hypothetical protein [Lentilactobacillus kosonis]|uniref:Uncharacterized protein n=1 Tax=Lentilactobacillus kosonis TaxID=2810561 RepID=A0A401FPH4_9LACO|nr:hypothetical protein [Lentilactobacillus kosonis]GAY74295.1 hypothetical protein NBRC111893_2441 [Lentilactobacillus kosonis]
MPMTNNGYDRPEIGELRDDINALFIQYFGEGIDLDDDQTPGLLAGVLSENNDQIEKIGQGVYNAFFVLKVQVLTSMTSVQKKDYIENLLAIVTLLCK